MRGLSMYRQIDGVINEVLLGGHGRLLQDVDRLDSHAENQRLRSNCFATLGRIQSSLDVKSGGDGEAGLRQGDNAGRTHQRHLANSTTIDHPR